MNSPVCRHWTHDCLAITVSPHLQFHVLRSASLDCPPASCCRCWQPEPSQRRPIRLSTCQIPSSSGRSTPYLAHPRPRGSGRFLPASGRVAAQAGLASVGVTAALEYQLVRVSGLPVRRPAVRPASSVPSFAASFARPSLWPATSAFRRVAALVRPPAQQRLDRQAACFAAPPGTARTLLQSVWLQGKRVS